MKNRKPHFDAANETHNEVANGQFSPKKRASHAREECQLPWPIEMLSLRRLRPTRRNARTHSKKQIGEIANSVVRFGFINPIIADSRNQIIAGHARAQAAELLGLTKVPVIRVAHLSEAEIRAFMLADNKLALKSGWDRELLAAELGELQITLPEIDLEIGITGFEPGEIDSIIIDFEEGRADPVDQIPEVDNITVSRTSDLFVLGKHRLLVGDAREESAYVPLMSGELADMAFLDPPYNVRVDGHVGGRGRIKHREFAFASGETTSEQFVQFLQATLGPCARHTAEGGISYVCMDWRHAGELLRAGTAVYDALKNICVWVKTTPGQGSFYRNQHEFVFVYKHGHAPHLNTFELGQHGRSRSNVWTYAGVNTFRAGRMDELKMHPTVKPVALIADAMRDCSRRGSVVLDVFAGSGTTIMAAEQIGRRAFCLEIDPRYVDVAIRRWQRFTGKDAMLESTGQTFEELAAARASNPDQAEKTPLRKKPKVTKGDQ
jgi:DNA modification methylase